MKRFFNIFIALFVVIGAAVIWQTTARLMHERDILKQVIARLNADTSVAQVLVAKVEFDQKQNKNLTTIKFVELDSQGKTLDPRYFTFSGNIIQFQALVIRFNDRLVAAGDKVKGKSAYVFWKAFMLDGKNTQEYEINPAYAIPQGYKVAGKEDRFEARLWGEFWEYALNKKTARYADIKNAQIEAPGTIFVPGTLYTIKIEHDGGLRIDAAKIPEIFRGENIM